jgi:hypothetical protein
MARRSWASIRSQRSVSRMNRILQTKSDVSRCSDARYDSVSTQDGNVLVTRQTETAARWEDASRLRVINPAFQPGRALPNPESGTQLDAFRVPRAVDHGREVPAD